ncbi:acetyltransferase (GNAT) family protein [Humibacillus xanthopallidus]|uniref:Acetyltransferase (GNAT) family protein n=1 Tax=Humibacillus xanthopallidus TaxID=412689 RepID=A0A543PSF3_9MICO|nr:GNAT family N-acetyltransferase [Humibacillus xanthopallidus]TQN47013.1 acetyltransferase (GNAT) family protein [Humibacillus xanthopallidus]
MDIIPLDRDDDVMLKEIFGVACRSEAVSRVQPIQRTEEEFLKMVRFDFPGEREEGAVAMVDGSPAGWARVFFPERDNLDKCWTQLEVDPQHRGEGLGSALVTWTEERARAAKRDMLLTEVFVPVGARESHADREFALRRGYAVSSVEIVRSLPLPVDRDAVARHQERASEAMGDAYELSVHVNGVPHELRQGVCDASNRLILDAPTGDVEFEPESMTVEDYQVMLDQQRDAGRTIITTVALHRETGAVAAYTDLVMPSGDPHIVFQWGTLVLPEHRGHRLGMAVKIANLEELTRLAPERRTVQTMNDEQNPWMVEINKDLGFEIIEEALTMKTAF